MLGMKTNNLGDRATLVTGLLDPLGRCLTPAVARRILQLRADAATQQRVQELADKCNEGQLTAEERAQYEAYVSTSTFVGILQAKARAYPRRHKWSRHFVWRGVHLAGRTAIGRTTIMVLLTRARTAALLADEIAEVLKHCFERLLPILRHAHQHRDRHSAAQVAAGVAFSVTY